MPRYLFNVMETFEIEADSEDEARDYLDCLNDHCISNHVQRVTYTGDRDVLLVSSKE